MDIVETGKLLQVVGRRLENGELAPVQNADWKGFSAAVTKAGQACYKAAQAKNQEAVADCTGDLSDACESCHAIYLHNQPKL